MSMNPFRGKTQYFEFGPRAADQIERLIKAVEGTPPIGETSIAQNVKALLLMVGELGSVPSNLKLQLDKLDLIHGLLSDIVSSDPEKIKELAAKVRAVREKLQTSVDNQTKGD